MKEEDSKVLVAIGEPLVPGGPNTVLLGMPEGAWAYMEGGLTHTFDLRKVGIHVQIVIYRGADHEAVMALAAEAAKASGAPLIDQRRDRAGKLPNIGIDDPTVQ